MKYWLQNIHLEGQKVQLVPLDKTYRDQLLEAASDGKLWELWYTSVPSSENIDNYIEQALQQKQKGFEYPFIVLDVKNGEVIGTTRFYNLQPEHRHLEIGYTWYAQSHQRTGVNTACKYLMLKYAFEELNCIAVQFMTNWHNLRSRTAIARLGAKQDGVLRNHRLLPDGTFRDTVVFSITNQEWIGVKKSLEYEMKKYDNQWTNTKK
ncbi:MAG: GNAT family protein [Bacteroidota bacterium]